MQVFGFCIAIWKYTRHGDSRWHLWWTMARAQTSQYYHLLVTFQRARNLMKMLWNHIFETRDAGGRSIVYSSQLGGEVLRKKRKKEKEIWSQIKANKQERNGLRFIFCIHVAKWSCSERVNKAVKVSHVYHFYSDSQVEFVKHTLIPLEVVWMLVAVATIGGELKAGNPNLGVLI